jgi:hypothetical protein
MQCVFDGRVPATLCTIINSTTKESKCWDWIDLLRLFFFVMHDRKWTVARFDRRTADGSLADVTVEFFRERWTKAVFLYNIWSQTCLGRPYNWKDLIVWWLNFLFTKKVNEENVEQPSRLIIICSNQTRVYSGIQHWTSRRCE